LALKCQNMLDINAWCWQSYAYERDANPRWQTNKKDYKQTQDD